jgi:mannose-1-phosphate guanylyltransferase
MDELSLYWKNATADAVGEKHGVSDRELKDLAPRIKQVHTQMAADRKAGKLRFRDLPYDDDMVAAVNKEVEHFRDRCEVLIVLGIGGSALGNVALQSALNPYTYNLMSDRTRTGPQLFVLDNVDPDQIKAVVELITPRIKKTIVNVISKSGETAETASQFILFRDLLQQKLGKKYTDNILATTDPKGGTLRQIATAEGYRTLEVPDGVGGRFSVLSAVGLFSAGMCGIDVEAILSGAAAMDKRCKDADLLKNPAALIAAIHYALDRKGKNISVMMPYATSLYYLGDWFRQLWAESLGEEGRAVEEERLRRPDAGEGAGHDRSALSGAALSRGAQRQAHHVPRGRAFQPEARDPRRDQGRADARLFERLQLPDPHQRRKARHRVRPCSKASGRRSPCCSARRPGDGRASSFTCTNRRRVHGRAARYQHLRPAGRRAGKQATYALMGKDGYADLAKRIEVVRKRDKKYLVVGAFSMQYGVIMAGGAGTRLWPVSRNNKPKQLISVVKGKSLLQLSYDRLRGMLPPQQIFVCTGAQHGQMVLENLPELPKANLIGEPEGRDTANAVGFMSAILAKRDKDAVAAFVTADHVIEPVDVFQNAIRTAFDLVAEHPDALVTFGIVPTHGHTGLGYVHRGEPLPVKGNRSAGAFKVQAFKEKPDKPTADRYVESGRYYWNSGMFVWRCDTVFAELGAFLPENHKQLAAIADAWSTPRQDEVLNATYPKLKKISVDFAIMEPASQHKGKSQVMVVEMPVKWLDVGSWPALAETLSMDAHDNATDAGAHVLLSSDGNIIISTDPEHLVSTIGLSEMIIVHTKDATLVCPKADAQRVKELAEVVKAKFGDRYR